MPNDIVLSNPLIEAIYHPAGINQMRLLFACLLQVQSLKTLDPDRVFSISAAGLVDLIGNEKLNNYGHMKQASDDLLNMVVTVEKPPNGLPGEPDRKKFNLVDGCEYFDGQGRLEISFTRHAAPYISDLSSFFTKLDARFLFPLKSGYSVRLYQLFIELLTLSGEPEVIKEFSVDEFREQFGLSDRYPRMKDLTRRVIHPAVAEINKKTDIRVRYGQRMAGRKITAFQFFVRFKVKPAAALPAAGKKPALAGYITAHAQPGESWDQASQRLRPEWAKL